MTEFQKLTKQFLAAAKKEHLDILLVVMYGKDVMTSQVVSPTSAQTLRMIHNAINTWEKKNK